MSISRELSSFLFLNLTSAGVHRKILLTGSTKPKLCPTEPTMERLVAICLKHGLVAECPNTGPHLVGYSAQKDHLQGQPPFELYVLCAQVQLIRFDDFEATDRVCLSLVVVELASPKMPWNDRMEELQKCYQKLREVLPRALEGSDGTVTMPFIGADSRMLRNKKSIDYAHVIPHIVRLAADGVTGTTPLLRLTITSRRTRLEAHQKFCNLAKSIVEEVNPSDSINPFEQIKDLMQLLESLARSPELKAFEEGGLGYVSHDPHDEGVCYTPRRPR